MGVWASAVERWVANLPASTCVIEVSDARSKALLQSIAVTGGAPATASPIVIDVCETLAEGSGEAMRLRIVAKAHEPGTAATKRAKRPLVEVSSLPVLVEFARAPSQREEHDRKTDRQERKLVDMALNAMHENHVTFAEGNRQAFAALQTALNQANARVGDLERQRDRLETENRELKAQASEAVSHAEMALTKAEQTKPNSPRDQAMNLISQIIETHGSEILTTIVDRFAQPPAPAAQPASVSVVQQQNGATVPTPAVVEVTGTVVDMPRH